MVCRRCVCVCGGGGGATPVSHSPFFRRVGADNPIIKHHIIQSLSTTFLLLPPPPPQHWLVSVFSRTTCARSGRRNGRCLPSCYLRRRISVFCYNFRRYQWRWRSVVRNLPQSCRCSCWARCSFCWAMSDEQRAMKFPVTSPEYLPRRSRSEVGWSCSLFCLRTYFLVIVFF